MVAAFPNSSCIIANNERTSAVIVAKKERSLVLGRPIDIVKQADDSLSESLSTLPESASQALSDSSTFSSTTVTTGILKITSQEDSLAVCSHAEKQQ